MLPHKNVVDLTAERGTEANTGSASRKSAPEVNIENGTGIDYLDQLIEEEKKERKKLLK